jgi:DNA invertase Pin-like site-specific DNA recombinase
VKPLIYGYMRVNENISASDQQQVERTFQNYAEREGFCYATTFCEYVPGSLAAFVELMEALKRAEARHVVVPSLSHLSAHPILRAELIDQLASAADATVFALDEVTTTPTTTERSVRDDNGSWRSRPPIEG